VVFSKILIRYSEKESPLNFPNFSEQIDKWTINFLEQVFTEMPKYMDIKDTSVHSMKESPTDFGKAYLKSRSNSLWISDLESEDKHI